MAQYSIRDLEQLSGIKAHTIRIWEKRYQLIKPERTNTNIRLYSEKDLRRILNISILSRHGLKISRIAALQEKEISEKVLHLSQNSAEYKDQIEAFVMAMLELDETKFNRAFAACVMKIGFRDTFSQIIFPFLEKVGLLWQAGTIKPAHEHFITALIRQKLIATIDGSQTVSALPAKKFLLFMQEDDQHELSLLYYSYLLQSQGQKVLYLGSSVPFCNISAIYDQFKPDSVLTLFISPIRESYFYTYMSFFSEKPRNIRIFVSGQQLIRSNRKLP